VDPAAVVVPVVEIVTATKRPLFQKIAAVGLGSPGSRRHFFAHVQKSVILSEGEPTDLLSSKKATRAAVEGPTFLLKRFRSVFPFLFLKPVDHCLHKK
jgi:hypothetical protein